MHSLWMKMLVCLFVCIRDNRSKLKSQTWLSVWDAHEPSESLEMNWMNTSSHFVSPVRAFVKTEVVLYSAVLSKERVYIYCFMTPVKLNQHCHIHDPATRELSCRCTQICLKLCWAQEKVQLKATGLSRRRFTSHLLQLWQFSREIFSIYMRPVA